MMPTGTNADDTDDEARSTPPRLATQALNDAKSPTKAALTRQSQQSGNNNAHDRRPFCMGG